MPTTTRTLVVLRHAKAEPAQGGSDEIRPLALTGRRQASSVGHHLQDAGLLPEVVLVSTALRTRQTWDLAQAGLREIAPEVDLRDELYAALREIAPEVDLRDELYAASAGDLLEAVRGVDARVRTLLVVGHEPAVSGLAAYLAGDGSDSSAVAQVRAGVPTASLSVLRAEGPWDGWGRGSARLEGVFRPQV